MGSGCGQLWLFEGARSEEELLGVMMGNPELTQAALAKVPVRREGGDALERVLACDETVIPLLVERFLVCTSNIATDEEDEEGGDDGWDTGNYDLTYYVG